MVCQRTPHGSLDLVEDCFWMYTVRGSFSFFGVHPSPHASLDHCLLCEKLILFVGRRSHALPIHTHGVSGGGHSKESAAGNDAAKHHRTAGTVLGQDLSIHGHTCALANRL